MHPLYIYVGDQIVIYIFKKRRILNDMSRRLHRAYFEQKKNFSELENMRNLVLCFAHEFYNTITLTSETNYGTG